MFRVSIAPHWTIEGPEGRGLGARVVELLVQVDEHGSLAGACTATGVSYRHAWQLLREGESLFGQPLLVMSRGKGSELTPLGERLVWAQRRIQARLSPVRPARRCRRRASGPRSKSSARPEDDERLGQDLDRAPHARLARARLRR